MPNIVEHNQLPWYIDDTFGYMIDNDRDYITLIFPYPADAFSKKDEVAVANSKFIIKACNNYDRMIELLKDVINYSNTTTEVDLSGNFDELVENVEDFLAEIGEGVVTNEM